MPNSGEITADPSLEQAKKTSAVFKSLLQKPHGQHGASVREDSYKGHQILVRTIYEIEIDGRPFHGNLDVSNSGTVQYHGIPNVSSKSAIELIRTVIDTFPDDFKAKPKDEPHGDHAHHAGAETIRPRKTRRSGKVKLPRKLAAKSVAKEKRHARSRKHSR